MNVYLEALENLLGLSLPQFQGWIKPENEQPNQPPSSHSLFSHAGSVPSEMEAQQD